jgi:hypothetical protein
MPSRHAGKPLPKADTRADPVIQHALDQGYLDSGEPFTVPGMPDHQSANEGRLSVNRAARRRNLSPGAWVADQDGNPCYQDCQNPDAPHLVKFRLWSKNAARTHVFRETGGDPGKLKYNPWTSHKTVRHDDSGQLPG